MQCLFVNGDVVVYFSGSTWTYPCRWKMRIPQGM